MARGSGRTLGLGPLSVARLYRLYSGARKVGRGHGMTPSGRYAGDDFVACADHWSPLTEEVVAGKRSARMCVMYRAV